MKLTVPTALSTRPVSQDGAVPWINNECRVLLYQLRQAANAEYRERKTAATLGAGAYVTVWHSPVFPANACQVYKASVDGVTTSGTAQAAGYVLRACYRSVASVLSQVGATTGDTFETAAACDARFAIDATSRWVYLEVRDDGVSPMNWAAVVDVNEVAL